jgi:hypothetical protein
MLHANKNLCAEVFELLQDITPTNVDPGNGGMDLWKILVLVTLRLNCNWDYDKVHNMANEHKTIRQFLGHALFDFNDKYGLQTIKDNISLLKSEIIDKINELVVKAGHQILLLGVPEARFMTRNVDSALSENSKMRGFRSGTSYLPRIMSHVNRLVGIGVPGYFPWRRNSYDQIRRQK